MMTKEIAHGGETVGGRNERRATNVSKGKYTTTRPKAQAPHNAMKAHAFRYASDYGWRVLPVLDKVPATDHGHLDATTIDPDRPEDGADAIRRMFDARRHNGVGVRMGGDGKVNGGRYLVAPEIDEREKGGGNLQDFYRLAGVRMGEYKTPTMKTPGGWRMICYVPTFQDCDFGDLHVAPGIEIKGDGGQVVLPPSLHPLGKRYQWVEGLEPWNVDVAPVPAVLFEKIKRQTRQDRQDSPGTAPAAHGGRWTLEDAERMLAVLDPWQDGYDWWLSILAALHSEFGDDALPLAESWADGKPGEVARKFKSFRKGGVTLGTLVHYAKLAGWQPAPRPTPEIWQVTREDIAECPYCGMTWHTPTAKGGTVTVILSCGNKDCPGERKRRAKDHFGRVQDWQAVYLAMIEDGKPWRKAQETARQDAPDFVGLPMGASGVMFVSPVPVGNYQWQALTPEDAIATLTGGLELMPKGKRIRHAHGHGPRSGKRLELAPELRDLVYTFPHKDMPILEDAYRQSGIRYTVRHGRLASRDALTADQITTLAQRLADIAATRRGWRKVGKRQRMRALRFGTSPHGKRSVPIHGLGDPVELSTYRQTSLQVPSEVPKSP